jgi:hypothetical protein
MPRLKSENPRINWKERNVAIREKNSPGKVKHRNGG